MYNKYFIYVLCSRFEGNPKTLLEAMSCGCTVVATNVDGINNIVENKINGYLVEEHEEDLRKILIYLKKNQTIQSIVGENARKYILKNNSFTTSVKNEITLYENITK